MPKQDTTLRTIVETLPDAQEFVRRVLGNMTGCSGDCQVRFAVDRKTRRPDYLVEMLIFDEVTGLEIIHIQSLAVVSGRTHEGDLVDATNIRRAWSTEAMTFKQVQLLLGELRGYSP